MSLRRPFTGTTGRIHIRHPTAADSIRCHGGGGRRGQASRGGERSDRARATGAPRVAAPGRSGRAATGEHNAPRSAGLDQCQARGMLVLCRPVVRWLDSLILFFCLVLQTSSLKSQYEEERDEVNDEIAHVRLIAPAANVMGDMLTWMHLPCGAAARRAGRAHDSAQLERRAPPLAAADTGTHSKHRHAHDAAVPAALTRSVLRVWIAFKGLDRLEHGDTAKDSRPPRVLAGESCLPCVLLDHQSSD